MTFRCIGQRLPIALIACLLSQSVTLPVALAQRDVERQTVAITYPLD